MARKGAADSLQWRIFFITMGLGLGTGVVAALIALTVTDMLNPPNLRLWLAVIGIAALAGFLHYLIFKFALRRQFARFQRQFYALIEKPAPKLEPPWKSTEIDEIDALFDRLIGELREYIQTRIETEAQLIRAETQVERLQRYFSPEVARIVGATGDEAQAPRRMSVTVLFSDIRGFTRLSETLPADDVVKLLNAYFTATIDLIYQERGTVLKLIGDGVMAVFGAPIPQSDDVERAARVAVRLPAAFDAVARAWSAETGHPLPRGIGVGLACGEVVVGNIGAPAHLDYTVIGDTVNVASRLSGEATAGQVLVTREVAARLLPESGCLARSLESVAVKGKEQPVEVAELTAEPAVAGRTARG